MTAKSSERWSAFVMEQSSSPYSNTGTGKHFVLIRWRTISSEAALPTLPNIELDKQYKFFGIIQRILEFDRTHNKYTKIS